MIVAPSILSMDFTQTLKQLKEIESSHAKWLHVDIMDGHFVPNLSFGPDITKQIRRHSKLFMDVHIMVEDAEHYSDVFVEAGANLLTFHLEACKDAETVHRIISKIHHQGCQVGLSIRPQTPVEAVFPYLNVIDLVLIMSVNPGYGGQSFMEESIERIRSLRKEIDANKYSVLIEVDGGINAETGHKVAQAGADVLVAGSYVFKNDIVSAVESLWKLK
jgi:ribulose-phosphate 3-epimerase